MRLRMPNVWNNVFFQWKIFQITYRRKNVFGTFYFIFELSFDSCSDSFALGIKKGYSKRPCKFLYFHLIHFIFSLPQKKTNQQYPLSHNPVRKFVLGCSAPRMMVIEVERVIRNNQRNKCIHYKVLNLCHIEEASFKEAPVT